ncbi:uncharacterized protein KIAA0895-like [Coregonus clupeaformis]|uniref:uncharacterized protein KIAA0895-like n=1 Tax=Coregonus clupeaformis TaxID=59861 RepID=UPI001E1C4C47|nr:uncharacterized protein KIAA0895-like [Coregonus clupeaformis]
MVLDPGEDCMDRTDVQGVRGSSSTTDLTGPEPRPDPRKTTTSDSTRLENTRPDAPKTTTTRKEETRPDTTKTINTTTTRTEGTRADPPKTTEEPTPDPPKTTTSTWIRARTSSVTKRERLSNSHNGPQPQPQLLGANVGLTPSPRASVCSSTDSSHPDSPYDGPVVSLRRDVTVATASSRNKVATRPPLRRPLSLDVTPLRLRGSEPVLDRRVLQPPWRSGGGPSAASSPPARSLTSPSLGPGGWMRRSESTCTVNNSSMGLRATRGRMRPATSLPHIARGFGGASTLPLPSTPRGPCLLVALRPVNLDQERQAFFQSDYKYDPQFEYSTPEPSTVLEKYREGSGLFLTQAVGIMECILRKFGNYENFEEVTGGSILPKSRVWAAARKYLQKENCVGEVVVCLSEELLSQAVMMVESCRPTLTINLSGARQHWLEGMFRHEIGTHYLRGVNNNLQPWSTSAGRKQYGLKPANPTEEGLASLHSVLLRKQPYLWRAALLYYTVYHAARMSFSQLFSHIAQFVQDPAVRWEYCLRAKRGQTDTSQPGCFSKDQVYLDGILRILRHRRNIDFKMLTSLGKVSFEDVERLRHIAVLRRTRIPHFMQDQEKYLQHLDHIVTVNELSDAQLRELLP